MTQPLISVIVPVYNLEKYIEKTLNSIFSQTYRNLEVIAVNDGSVDSTAKILDEYAKNEPRLVVIHKENEGVNKTRLTGIREAKGEYIGFVDGDDSIDADMYERLYSNAVKYNADISHCGYRMIFPDNSVKYYYNKQLTKVQNNKEGVADLLEGEFIEPCLCNKLFHRKLFSADFYKDKITDNSFKENEDLLMNYLLFKMSRCSVYEDFCPYQYIIRNTSASHGKINENILLDPIAIGEFLIDDTENSDGTIKMLAARYYVVKLIKAATMSYKECRELTFVRKNARKKLRSFSWRYLTVKNERISKRIQCVFAAYLPVVYNIIHSAYSR